MGHKTSDQDRPLDRKRAGAEPAPGRLDAEEEMRIGALVLEAATLAPEQRESFLRRLTTARPTLLEEVHRRLALAAELPESFLAVPAGELLDEIAEAFAARGEEARLVAGAERYELGESLGEGGMGRVLAAYDRQLRRSVALKLLHATSPGAARRLLEEARAQARVRHEYVLQVYDTGELAGRPYIAMQYVEGPGLLAIRQELSAEECVRLVAQAAEGLHAAHKVGLIHRDVKPANILVEARTDGRWRPWVADFGIAAHLGEEERTLAGTPAYMAPELLAAEPAQADRRADVYALGVTLYQLLSGELPRAGESLETFLRAARQQPATPIRERLPSISKELEAIVHKCLEQDPARRYPSARALAEDLWRYLDGEEVEAYSASRAERLAGTIVRHRGLLSVAGAALLVLVAALGVAAALGVEARQANRRAEVRHGQAEELIGFMLDDLRARLAAVGRLDILEAVGERARRYFAAVPEVELSDDELAFRSQALYQIGEVHLERGELAAAAEPLAESLELARALAARDPGDGERLFGLGQSHFWVGHVAWERGEIERARTSFEAYLEISERLVALDPERPDWLLELSYSHSNLGFVQQERGEVADARRSFLTRLEIVAQLVELDPQNLEWLAELAAAHNTLGEIARRMGQLDQAELHFEHEHALALRAAEAEPENRRWQEYLGTSLHYMGAVKLDRGQHGAAAEHLLSAQRIFAELSEHDPENGAWRFQLAARHFWLGEVEYAAGRFSAASRQWSTALDLGEALALKDPANRDWRRALGIYACSQGRARTRLGEPEEALVNARRGIEQLERVLRSHPHDPKTLRWRSECLLLEASLHGAGVSAEEAREIFADALATIEPVARATKDGQHLDTYSRALAGVGRHAEARAIRQRLRDQGFFASDPLPEPPTRESHGS